MLLFGFTLFNFCLLSFVFLSLTLSLAHRGITFSVILLKPVLNSSSSGICVTCHASVGREKSAVMAI